MIIRMHAPLKICVVKLVMLLNALDITLMCPFEAPCVVNLTQLALLVMALLYSYLLDELPKVCRMKYGVMVKLRRRLILMVT